MHPLRKKKMWSALSLTFLYGFINLSVFICLASKISDFYLFSNIIVFQVLLIPMSILFIELMGYREKIWKFWKSVPILVHQLITAFCIFWGGYLCLKAFLPIIKEQYVKNSK